MLGTLESAPRNKNIQTLLRDPRLSSSSSASNCILFVDTILLRLMHNAGSFELQAVESVREGLPRHWVFDMEWTIFNDSSADDTPRQYDTFTYSLSIIFHSDYYFGRFNFGSIGSKAAQPWSVFRKDPGSGPVAESRRAGCAAGCEAVRVALIVRPRSRWNEGCITAVRCSKVSLWQSSLFYR